MNLLFVECLRAICILVLMIVMVWSGQTILYLAKPWVFWKKVESQQILLHPFEVVAKDKLQIKKKGEACARLLSSRLRQINAVLSSEISAGENSGAVLVEAVVPRQFKSEALIDAQIEPAVVKPLGIDVVGVLNYLRSNLRKGDRLLGHIEVRDDEVDVFAELVAVDDVVSPWDFTVPGGVNEGLSYLANAIFKEQLGDVHPLADLNVEQFGDFVVALRNYQQYARSASGVGGSGFLELSRRQFEDLKNQNVDCSLVYAYLASIQTLGSDPDVDSAIALLKKASSIDPDDTSIRDRLDSLEKRRPTFVASEKALLPGESLVMQPALQHVRLPEALETLEALGAMAVRRKVKVAILTNGVNTALPGISARIAASESFVVGEDVAQDKIDYGTHIVSYLAAIAPSVELIVLKVLSEDGMVTSASLLAGVNFAVSESVDVLLCPIAAGRSGAEEKAFGFAVDAGVLVVASAGNNGSGDPVFPGAYEGVLAVGGTDLADRVESFSNHGNYVQLYAPADALAPRADGVFELRTGTAFSAALVAGVAALAMQTGEEKTAAEIREMLLDQSMIVSPSVKRIDALNTVNAAR